MQLFGQSRGHDITGARGRRRESGSPIDDERWQKREVVLPPPNFYLSYILLSWFIEWPGGVSLLSYEHGNHWHWGYPHATNDEKKTLIKKGETHRGGPIVTSGNRVKNWNWLRVWDNRVCIIWSLPIPQVSPLRCVHVVIIFYPCM